MSSKSILIIGATGRTGLHCLRQLAEHSTRPSVHAFCRNADKLADEDKDLCASIVEGDARNSNDLRRALIATSANFVVVCVGGGDSVAKDDVREASARALVDVLRRSNFSHVQVLVVSSVGAGKSKITVGMGIGKLISFHLRHVLKDHTNQENTFASIMYRTTIVRPSALTDNEPTGKLVTFQDTEKPPTIKTDRYDLATWVTREICDEDMPLGGRVVNITGVKQ